MYKEHVCIRFEIKINRYLFIWGEQLFGLSKIHRNIIIKIIINAHI